MKHLLQHQPSPTTQYLHQNETESETVTLNESVNEKFNQSPETLDTEQRLAEANRVALSAMPEFAREIFEKIESGTKVKKLEKFTRNKVFEVLEGTNANVNNTNNTPNIINTHWGNEYKETIKAIKEEKTNAILSVENVERATETLASLKTKYEAQVALHKQTFNATEEFKRKWYTLGLPFGERKSLGSERSRFTETEQTVRDVLETIRKQLSNRMEEAKTYNERTQEILSSGFESLTPAQKTIFLTQVQAEIDGHHPSGDPYDTIISGTHPQQRLDAYKKLHWNKKYQQQEIATLATDQETLRNRNLDYRNSINSLTPNFDNIKTWTQEEKATSTPPDLKTLNQNLKAHLTTHGSIDFSSHYAGMHQTDLDEYAHFLVLSNYLGANEATTKALPTALKKQLLGYIKHLEDTERPNNQETFSTAFNTQHGEIKTLYGRAKTDINTLSSVTLQIAAPHINPNHYTTIQNFISEVSTKKQEYEQVKSTLDANEQEIIEKHFKKLEDLADKLSNLETTWREKEQEQAQYTTNHGDWNTRKGILEGRVTLAEGLSSTTTTEQRVRSQHIQTAEATLQNHLTQEPTHTQLPILSTFLGELKIQIEKTSATINAQTINTTQTWSTRIQANLKAQSQEIKNKQYREDLTKYQKQAFDTLLKTPNGRAVEIDHERYAHGKDFACNDVLRRTPTIHNNLSILDKTADAVILRQRGSQKLFVIQMKNQKIQTLIFNNLTGYTQGEDLPQNFRFSKHPDETGEPMALKFN